MLQYVVSIFLHPGSYVDDKEQNSQSVEWVSRSWPRVDWFTEILVERNSAAGLNPSHQRDFPLDRAQEEETQPQATSNEEAVEGRGHSELNSLHHILAY
jgi:hypothetical protein